MDNQSYYPLPFNMEALLKENGSLPVCGMAESIAHHLMLLLTTRKGENRFDPDYGNAVWDMEFENAATAAEWEAVFVASMKDQIARYEPRITAPAIAVRIEYVEHSYETRDYSEIRKKAKIAINARLVETDERFSFSTEL